MGDQPSHSHSFDAGAAWAQMALQATLMKAVAGLRTGVFYEHELVMGQDFKTLYESTKFLADAASQKGAQKKASGLVYRETKAPICCGFWPKMGAVVVPLNSWWTGPELFVWRLLRHWYRHFEPASRSFRGSTSPS